MWPKFTNAVIDSAHFLSSYKTIESFYSFIEKFYNDPYTKNLLPIHIALNIRGFSIALSADFLKEIGYVNYGKPDVHLKDILIAANIINEKDKFKFRTDYYCLDIIDKIASEVGITSYAVDKTLWLIGSGNFYKNNINKGNNKKHFINFIKGIN